MQAILVNFIPIIGIVFFSWDAKILLASYWLENVVNGFFHLIRIAKSDLSISEKLFMIPFFTIHYGGFCTGHGFFIVAITTHQSNLDTFFLENWGELNLMFFNNHFFIILAAFLIIYTWDLLAGSDSHTQKGSKSSASIMSQPYTRIIFLHIGIVMGGVVAMAQNSPLWILIILVGAKSIYDIRFALKKQNKELNPSNFQK